MLKIKDNIDLKELEKYGMKPRYNIKNIETGETYIAYYESDKYIQKFGWLFFRRKYKPYNKILRITNRKIHNLISAPAFELEYNSFVDVDLLYDLIKADIVEKVDD